MTKATAQLTELEFQLMDLYAHCEMTQLNGATPTQYKDVNTYLWADERAAALEISEQAVGGLLTSLQNKGFIGVVKPTRQDKDGSFWFTETGFDAWHSAREAYLAEAADV